MTFKFTLIPLLGFVPVLVIKFLLVSLTNITFIVFLSSFIKVNAELLPLEVILGVPNSKELDTFNFKLLLISSTFPFTISYAGNINFNIAFIFPILELLVDF